MVSDRAAPFHCSFTLPVRSTQLYTAWRSRATLTTTVSSADAMSAPPRAEQSAECQHHKASRLRGGGAGKDCFLGALGCFICFEGCKDCCECIADIVCECPRLPPRYSLPHAHVPARLPLRDVLLSGVVRDMYPPDFPVRHRAIETGLHTLYCRRPFCPTIFSV